jgi:hypothetical protein
MFGSTPIRDYAASFTGSYQDWNPVEQPSGWLDSGFGSDLDLTQLSGGANSSSGLTPQKTWSPTNTSSPLTRRKRVDAVPWNIQDI